MRETCVFATKSNQRNPFNGENKNSLKMFPLIFENQNIQFRGGLGIISTFGRTYTKLSTLPRRHTQVSILTRVVVTSAVYLT